MITTLIERQLRTPARLVAVLILVGVTGLPGRMAAEEMSQTQADAIISELREIRLLLEKLQPLAAPPGRPGALAPSQQATPANERVQVTLGTTQVLGHRDATLTLIEFTDYQCPFCRQFHVSTFEQLKKHYIDTGKLRYVSRDLPLPIHPHAMAAALAARCASDQGKYWEMRHTLFVNAGNLSPDAFTTFAGDLGLDVGRFRTCMTARTHAAAIERDLSDAQASGITGTPTFVLGRTTTDGLNGVKIVGALPYAVFETRLKEMLAGE